MRVLFVITLLASLVLPPLAFAEVQTFTATHTYILGDRDSKEDARQRCLLETKRKILEQAGVYIESESEVKNFDLTKDKITSFAAAVMQVKDTKEKVGFENGHMTLTLTTTAQVDLAEVRKQLAARQLDAGVRDDVAFQRERLKRLEAQLEAMQRQQRGQSSGRAPASPPSDIASPDLQRLKAQAAQGDPVAQVKLGYTYDFGKGVPQDYTKAREWYEKAAAQGIAEAQILLGLLYAKGGQGVPQDYAQAAKWYEKAAAQGNANAQIYLGMAYYKGEGVPQDSAQAAKLFQKAAPRGDVLVQYTLGALYFMGDGVPQDYAKAREWYEKAAAQGNDFAQFKLGSLYEEGKGVPQDYAKAREWYEKAAAQGNADAQVALGGLYFFGQGMPADIATARGWFAKSATQGNALAMVHFGAMYEYGQGAPQNDMQAYMWYSLAAERSSDIYAADNRDKVAQRMTPAQIAEAQRLATQCQTQQFKGC